MLGLAQRSKQLLGGGDELGVVTGRAPRRASVLDAHLSPDDRFPLGRPRLVGRRLSTFSHALCERIHELLLFAHSFIPFHSAEISLRRRLVIV